MVGRFGPGWRARRRAWVGAAASAAALLAVSGSATAAWLPVHDLSPVGNATSPRLVAGADGVVHAFWDRDGAGGIETAAHVPGVGWPSEPLRLSAAGAETGIVRPAANAAGDLVAIWYEVNGGLKRIQSAVRAQDGTWSAPETLPTVRDVVSPALAIAPDGTATAMWTELDALTSMTAIRSSVRPRGGSWSAPVTVSNPAEHSFSPNVVVDRQGTATVLWYQATAGGINRTYASSRPAGGAWTTPELLSHRDWAGTSNVAVADDGTVFATWRAREPSLRYAAEVAVRRPDGSWSVSYDVDGGATLGNNSDTPDVAVGRDGEATVAWTRKVGDWNVIQTITRAAGGETWSAPRTLSADGRNAFGQRVAYDPDGNAIVTWHRRNDVNYIVQVTERAADGSWSEPANLSAPAASSLELSDLSLTFDGDGDTIVTWYRADGVAGRRVQTTTDDTQGPRLGSLTVPETATTGEPVSFSVAPLDLWSGVAETAWAFGDGASAAGSEAEHAYAAAGTYEVRVAATDLLGNVREQSRTIVVADRPVVEPPRREEPPVVQPPVDQPPRQDPPVVDPPRAQPRPSARAAVVCRVPKLVGTTFATAKRRIRAADCRLGKVRYVTTRTRRDAGKVVRVSRRAGARLKKGAKVDVTVARRAGRAPRRNGGS